MFAVQQPVREPPRRGFVRAVFVLIGGTAFAHGITAVTMPIVSRLYTPSDFSSLAVFTSLAAILSVAACLRFDVAVSLPENDDDATNLLGLAIVCALAVSLAVAAVVLLAPDWIAQRLGRPEIGRYLWMLPIGVFFAAASSAFQGWFVRARDFGRLARARVAQSGANAALQLGLGLTATPPLGLLAGAAVNAAAACAALGWGTTPNRPDHRHVSALRMANMFRAHGRFPKYSTWEALGNSAANQVPIIMIAALAAPSEAGHLSLAIYAMQAPMALVGTAIAQVYLSRAPEQFRAGTLGAFTTDIFGGLLKAGAGPLIAMGILSPIVFGFVFGAGWERAGTLVGWMTPWFMLQFLASPISMALHVTGHQPAAMLLQGFSLLTRVAAVWGAQRLAPERIGEAFALSGLLVYLVYLVLALRLVGARGRPLIQAVASSLPVTAAWIAGAAAGGAAFTYLTGGRA